MRKTYIAVLFLFVSILTVFSQNNEIYKSEMTPEEKFTASDLKGKLKIISSIDPSEKTYEFYRKAVEYTALNSGFYKNDPFFDEIYIRSVTGMLKILNSSPKSRLKSGSASINELLDFISEKPDAAVLHHLFRMKNIKYSDEIRKKAEYLFNTSSVPYFSAASDIIVKNPVQDKLEILTDVLNNTLLSKMEKGELSARAMEAALQYKVSDHRETEAVKNLLTMCVDVIYDFRWSEASYLVLEYFDRLIAYENKDAVRSRLIKTIKTIGVLGSHEAAVRLSMYIGVINSFVEQGLDYDGEILSEIISSLGQIGDLAAYENLSEIENLGYSWEIISISKEALKKLKISR